MAQVIISFPHLGDSSYRHDFCLNNYCPGNHLMSRSLNNWYHSDGLGCRGGIFVTAEAVVAIGTLRDEEVVSVFLLDTALILHSVCMDSVCV